MSWLFSQALVAEYSEANSLDGAPCALWSGTPTPQACSWLGKTTDAYRLSRSGMMFKPLTDANGEAVLMSFLEAFPAKIFPQQEKAQGSMGSAAECGPTWPASLAKFDPASSSWRTHQCLLFEDSTECFETFPRWGSMRDGELWEQTPPAFPITAPDCGWLPTPTTSSALSHKNDKVRFDCLSAWCRAKFGSGYPNPRFWETIMAWPTSWTDAEQSATDKFQQWQHSHGEF